MADHDLQHRARRAIAGGLGALADLIWPPRSLLSEAIVSAPGAIEPELWAGLAFLGAPCCARCGFPLPSGELGDPLCAACLADPPAFDAARAALAYDDASRPLILALKHAGRRDGLPTFGRWMAEAAAPLLADADLIVPTPLHWTRLAQRRFNQAAWLAQALSRAAGGPAVSLFGLARIKARKSQAGLTARQRALNVRGAFRADRRRVAGRSILLVDDVHTTGATLAACARALKRAGARRVAAVTLARVVRPTEVTI